MQDQLHEIDQERQKARREQKDAAQPGRASTSAAMQGPNEPVASGITKPQAGAIAPDVMTKMSAAEASPATGLPADLRGELETSLGTDLGGVRLHTGTESADAAGALEARAYTVGRDIYFADGAYNPESEGGRGLIAHEVAHVVQNGGSGAVGDGMQLSSPGDAHEHEAHAFGEAFASGEPARAPVTRSSTVGRAMVSRDKDDPVVTPKHGKGSAGASGKLTTKSAEFQPYVAYTRNLTSPAAAVDVKATLMLLGTGKLEWPDLLDNKSPVEVGGGSSKDENGGKSGKGGVDIDVAEYTIKANERAKEEQEWWDSLNVEEIKLVGGVSGDGSTERDASGNHKNEKGIGASIKCEVTLKGGTKVTGSVNILSIKSGEEKIEGPNITLVAAYKQKLKKWDLGKGVTASVELGGTGTVVVKPNWGALAREAAKLVLDAGLVGAIEFASTMAVIFAPALFFAAGLSMIDDETQLFHWAVKEAKESERGAAALAYGTKMQKNFASGDRAAKAYERGLAAAQQAIAKTGCTEDQYKQKWEEFSTGSDLHGQCLKAAENKFFAAVDARARAMYQGSLSMKIFKTEADVLSAWREKARLAWLSALRGGL